MTPIRRLAPAAATALAIAWVGTAAAHQEGSAAADPDVLYQDRERVASASAAADIWGTRLAVDPADFEAAWKLARARSWIGERAPRDARKRQYELGMEAARAAIARDPSRPEGHFWLAVNMGALASASPIRAGLKYRVAIREALETVIRIDPAFSRGVGHCALGKYYLQVPWLFGGSKAKAESLLRSCLAYDTTSAMAHYFLAQVFAARDRREEAVAELEQVLGAPEDGEFGPETRIYKRKAARLLGRTVPSTGA